MPAALLLAAALAIQPSPDDRAAVLRAVDRFLAAIGAHDPDAYAAAQLAEGMTFSQRYHPDGRVELKGRANGLRADDLRTPAKANAAERYWSPTVMIRRDMAVVWAPYAFDLDGQRAHCGIDVFNLVRADGAWKIANAAWTIEPGACPELEATR